MWVHIKSPWISLTIFLTCPPPKPARFCLNFSLLLTFAWTSFAFLSYFLCPRFSYLPVRTSFFFASLPFRQLNELVGESNHALRYQSTVILRRTPKKVSNVREKYDIEREPSFVTREFYYLSTHFQNKATRACIVLHKSNVRLDFAGKRTEVLICIHSRHSKEMLSKGDPDRCGFQLKKSEPDVKCSDHIKAKVNKGPWAKPFKEIAFSEDALIQNMKKISSTYEQNRFYAC